MTSIDQKTCNESALQELHKFQDEHIEHKEPITHGYAFYYSEATGDIVRELTKACWFDKSYISEKTKKLKNFSELVGQDELDKCETYIDEKDIINKDTWSYIKKLDNFKEKIEKTDFSPGDKDRKKLLLEAVSLQKNIALWGTYWKSSFDLKSLINSFVYRVKEAL